MQLLEQQDAAGCLSLGASQDCTAPVFQHLGQDDDVEPTQAVIDWHLHDAAAAGVQKGMGLKLDYGEICPQRYPDGQTELANFFAIGAVVAGSDCQLAVLLQNPQLHEQALPGMQIAPEDLVSAAAWANGDALACSYGEHQAHHALMPALSLQGRHHLKAGPSGELAQAG